MFEMRLCCGGWWRLYVGTLVAGNGLVSKNGGKTSFKFDFVVNG